jgi:succinate-semialdehyde dehydrogenase/glutarate-semialdehyde dehydrogenase
VGAQAGYFIKKSVLELGGSDPFIVMPSADLTEAIKNAVQARCINNGQSCIAAKRFIVHESVYRTFEERFVEGMSAQVVGDPMAEETQIGPLATQQIAEDLQRQVDAAISAGGRLLTGGRLLKRDGNFFSPTVISGLPRTAPVTREETFGPLAFLFKVSSLDEAISLANDTPFGLGASCWTNETAEQQRLALELQCGSVFFNTQVASDPRLPFGGIKHSGYGRELSAAGMREFLNAKTVVIAATAMQLAPKPDTESKFVLPVREQPLMTAKAEAAKAKKLGGIATLGLTDSEE